MSGGVFTDENGQTYVVAPDGSLQPVSQGAQPKPKANLSDLAKSAGMVTEAASGAGLGSVLGGLSGGGAATAAEMGGHSLGGAATLGGAAAPAGYGTLATYAPGAIGAYGLYDLSQNRERIGTGAGYLEGAASGAGVGWTVGNMIAPGAGGVVGAGVGGLAGLAANALGIGHQSRTRGEEKLRDQLAEQGITVPNVDTKEWENNAKFAESRNEADLVGKDIIHAGDFYANIAGYDKLDAAKQEAIANEALKQGLIRERLGKIEVGSNSAFDEYVKTQLPGEEVSGGGGGSRTSESPESKKNKKRAKLAQIIPELGVTPTRGPRYDINPSDLINNPYL